MASSSSSSASQSTHREASNCSDNLRPNCHCGVRAPKITSETNLNPGRRFYGCANYKPSSGKGVAKQWPSRGQAVAKPCQAMAKKWPSLDKFSETP
ncbi:hypothetical protein L1049_017162 [Liquidambar formosana]|uniref:Zinc finger GRF-type domain-containing protein n=1 Tax=Liquidambar formosana TaxID=63359 RepID=A0AAP0X135_LIQFO